MPQQYELTRPLGRGGFGLVYEAIDHKLRRRVAIKMMRAPSASSLYQLKREFRVAADFSHPNLVELHELVVSGLSCFVVMELIDGVGFLVYVRGGAHPDASNADTAPERDRRRLHPRVELDLDRLRGTLAQLVDAVQVLHDAGRIHRDIKPSNVLCTAAGRVVLVDFGLACVAARIDEITEEHRGAGTPAYMSPEQALGLPLEPATDWYSVGVLLYEALTGRHPYGGRGLEVIPIHHAFAPVPPERMSDAPRDLSDLAMALLRMEPHERPDGHEIARRLGRGPSRWPRPSSPRIVDFVGRRTEVAALETLLAKTEQRTPTIARVVGPSGIGKSALVDAFAARARDRGAVVLAGRCFENESVPYRGIDCVVDALSRHLLTLPDDVVAAMHKGCDVGALAQVFPVLQRVAAVARQRCSRDRLSATGDRPRRCDPHVDALAIRRRAIESLRTLLANLAARDQLVLMIDDLQWGDDDSAHVLARLFEAGGAPGLMLVTAYRRDAADSAPCVRALDAFVGDSVEIAVGPLLPDDAKALAAALASGDRAATLAEEANGDPFLLVELSRHDRGARSNTVADLIAARLAPLSRAARRVIESLAVHAGPIAADIVVRAAEAYQDALAELRAARLMVGTQTVRIYHDRVRELIADSLSHETTRDVHARLALALEAAGAEQHAMVAHYVGAGDYARAAAAAARAAERAASMFAFALAVELYRRALVLTPEPTCDLQLGLARMLEAAGRGREAADVYLEIARGCADDAEAAELRRRAAEQLLACGHVERGGAILGDILQAAGIRLHSEPRARAAAVALRARLALRGYHFAISPVDDDQTLRELDLLWRSFGKMIGGCSNGSANCGVAVGVPGWIPLLRCQRAVHVPSAPGVDVLLRRSGRPSPLTSTNIASMVANGHS